MKSKNISSVLLFFLLVSGSIFGQTSQEKIQILEQQLELLKKELQELKNYLKEKENPASSSLPHAGITQPSKRALSKPPNQKKKKSDPNEFRVYWKDGIRMDSSNKHVKIRIGGRIMNDWAFVNTDNSMVESMENLAGGTEFRRARLYTSGVLYNRFEYKAEYDFSAISGPFKDVYIGFREIPVLGKFRVGNFKEPFGLEELTSSNNITFLERSSGAVFSPPRNVGMAFQNSILNGNITYSAGVFRESANTGESVGSGGPNITGRVTALPIYDEKGRKLLHIGGAFSHQGAPLALARFSSRPEAHLLPKFVSTPNMETSSYNILGLEMAAVSGPFSVQTEYMKASVNSISNNDPNFSGFYVFGSYFLTGENRHYSKSKGAFNRIRPNKPFLDDVGMGAWEIAARFSKLNLNNGLIQGGEMSNVTLGLNWYMNPYSRIMWNYVASDVLGSGKANILQIRFKIDF